jgi:hypothetical protein
MKLVITAFQRPGYFERVLKSWAAARGLHRLSGIEIALEPSHHLNEMTYLANSIIPEANVHLNPTRLGVLENPYQAFHRAFLGEPDDSFVILGEDDCVVSTDVIEYFEWASRRFAGDPSVLGVCAFSWSQPVRAARYVKLESGFCPIVWGTWKNRWETVLGPTWDHDYSTGNPPGFQAGWDWNINLRVMGDRKFVWPVQSRSNHIGKWGGTHTQPDTFPSSQAPSFKEVVPIQDYAVTEAQNYKVTQ